jgi:hypothetical protein
MEGQDRWQLGQACQLCGEVRQSSRVWTAWSHNDVTYVNNKGQAAKDFQVVLVENRVLEGTARGGGDGHSQE